MSGGFELDFVYFETRLGWILVVTTEAGVSMVEFLGPAKPSSEKIESIIRKENPEAIPRGAIESSLAVKVMKHIVNYLQKRTPLPDIPIDVRKGTDFERGVWRAISAIPFGETRSYKQVAAAVGRPAGARAAGRACGSNPVPIIVPCHRVITTAGRLGGFSGGLDLKRTLLELERSR